ncbi:MAG: hypothetical protein PHF84_11625 [bacterium]|nr:hypothetical protein [bacterium]
MGMISIQYEIFGAVRTNFKENSGTISLPEGTSLHDFIVTRAGLEEKYLRYLDVTVDGRKYPFEGKLQSGMKIKVLMPIGGG